MSRVQIRAVLVALAMLALPGASLAQQVEESHPIAEDVASQISMFSYEEGPKSRLVFRGTPVAANGQGKAWVEYEKGNARIEVEVEKLPPPPRLGPYTVYILWALTPEGRAVNQGVIATNRKGSGEFKTSYGAPQFALIVTAEPHFAVSFPSTMVVLYNVADKVKGSESKVTALARSADYSKLTPIVKDKETNPIELVQARYALAIAAAAGAEKFAPQPFETARMKLMEAEAALADKKASVRKPGTVGVAEGEAGGAELEEGIGVARMDERRLLVRLGRADGVAPGLQDAPSHVERVGMEGTRGERPIDVVLRFGRPSRREVDLAEERERVRVGRVLREGVFEPGERVANAIRLRELGRLADEVVGLRPSLAAGLFLLGQSGECRARLRGLLGLAGALVRSPQEEHGLGVLCVGIRQAFEHRHGSRALIGANGDGREQELALRVQRLEPHHAFGIGERDIRAVLVGVDGRAEIVRIGRRRVERDGALQLGESLVEIVDGTMDGAEIDSRLHERRIEREGLAQVRDRFRVVLNLDVELAERHERARALRVVGVRLLHRLAGGVVVEDAPVRVSQPEPRVLASRRDGQRGLEGRDRARDVLACPQRTTELDPESRVSRRELDRLAVVRFGLVQTSGGEIGASRIGQGAHAGRRLGPYGATQRGHDHRHQRHPPTGREISHALAL